MREPVLSAWQRLWHRHGQLTNGSASSSQSMAGSHVRAEPVETPPDATDLPFDDIDEPWVSRRGVLAGGAVLGAWLAPPFTSRAFAAAEEHTRHTQASAIGDDASVVIDVRDLGAVGDGVTDDTKAIQAALDNELGLAVYIVPGTYKVSAPLVLRSRSRINFETGAVLDFAARGAGSMLVASGTESTRSAALTSTAAQNDRILTAPGHGLVAGDLFRLACDQFFDSSATKMRHGEILFVDSVSGDAITATTPIQAGAYSVANRAFVRKITPVTNIRITGAGIVRGARSAGLGQTGLSVALAQDVLIDGVTFQNIDRSHIRLSDCVDGWIQNCTFDWAVDVTQAYAISFVNACQDSGALRNLFENVRHSLSTNNMVTGYGIPRRIRFAHNTIRQTSFATGGSMGGGDAIDTHAAAEDIWIEYNTVLGSNGQGINFECPTGRVIGNVIRGTASYGISVHNESDLAGRVTVVDNDVSRAGNHGIYIRTGSRGTRAPYEYINASRNVVTDPTGSGVVIGSTTTGTPPERGILTTGNMAIRARGPYALLVTNASGVSASENRGIDGGAVVSVVDSAPPSGDDPGYAARTIALDAVTVGPAVRYLVVDTEAKAATDTLRTISGGSRGQVISVKSLSVARDVIIASTGNIRTQSAMTLDAPRDSITLGYDGSNWIEQGRANFPAA